MTKLQLFTAILVVCSFCLKTAAQDIMVMDMEDITVMSQGNLDDLLYPDQELAGPSKARQYVEPSDAVVSYEERITNMPQYIHDFIAQYVEAGHTVLSGGVSWLSDPSKGKIGSSNGRGFYYYPIKETSVSMPFTFPAGSTDSNAISQAASDLVNEYINNEYDILQSFLPYALLSINLDHSEIFWIGKDYSYGCIASGGSISYNPRSGQGTVNTTVTLTFPLYGNGIDIRIGGLSNYNFRNKANIASGVQTFNNSVQTILSQCQTGSRYDKLLAAHDWLTLHNCYNHYYPNYSQAQIGDTPWCALSALEGNNGQQAPVCEGYARAMKVLCDVMDIPCILMSGIAKSTPESSGGEHMWNYVQMEDGKWYAVDVTWDDPVIRNNTNYDVISGIESHKWFLLGSTTDVGGFTFIESHPEQWSEGYSSGGSYSWNLQPGPELSPAIWAPAFKRGDVNGDNGINIADAVSVLNAMAGQEVSGNPDVNGDGGVNIADFVTVLNIMAGVVE